MTYAHSAEAVVTVATSADTLFDYLDDQEHLGSHMQKPSMMMMGGRMTYEFDEARGRAVGSVIRMGGSVLGIRLSVDEIVVEHTAPVRKVWETRGQPRILVIGAYRMGFEISPSGRLARLRVFIEYDHPASFVGQLLAWVFGPLYARWCVSQMARDAERHFNREFKERGSTP
jgi:hypothetical protein